MITPKGKLIPVGGAEDKGTDLEQGFIQRNNLNFFEQGILRRIVNETKFQNESKIEVITTASMIPVEVGENYLHAFSKLSCKNVQILNIRNREDAQNQEYIERIKNADAVMISGGNQMRLTATFGGTELYHILQQRYFYEEGFLIAGTSAGAMAMSNTMIYEGNAANAHLKGAVKVTTGLAFMRDVIFDSHFDKRGRFGRLAQAVASNPQCIGIGLGEDTGLLITEGNYMEAIGSGMIVIIDGHNIKHSNIADLADGSPISIENLVVHFLAKGNKYILNERKYIAMHEDAYAKTEVE
ncbi:MAG: cyanophycinase [Bacteroidetes bacterium]|jgi:cyanophycinase|nr:cyanophycinase [Bacteroidota bacterium]HMT36431.1 cyanophycinase [Chitinophagaceae bacterium]MBK6821083.1 cyanophycinase [Bacteroidota bacterium]MBK7039318.1 cyanophycinase [Bacteroidota bacterium]MBK7588206.1 cyanophycinase [Bacteroidota bacterium]